jgi:hypothetical protein
MFPVCITRMHANDEIIRSSVFEGVGSSDTTTRRSEHDHRRETMGPTAVGASGCHRTRLLRYRCRHFKGKLREEDT